MNNDPKNNEELNDWVDALENLILFNGKEQASNLINEFFQYAKSKTYSMMNLFNCLSIIQYQLMKKKNIQETGKLKKNQTLYSLECSCYSTES